MGSGGGQPTTQYVKTETSNLPEYAKPYFTSMMGQAQALTDTTKAAPIYSGQRLAPFTETQRQVQGNILGMQTPGQFGGGSQLAGLAGLGSLGAGQRYAQMGGPQSFTQQGMAQQYMSPFIRNALDVQRNQAIRGAKQGQLAQDLGAARQGTYGGSRQLLASMERERNLGQQLGDIEATGMQAAYDRAAQQFNAEQQALLQNQQFGANLGLQGLAQAGQMGQTLGNLGQMQQQAEAQRLGMQQATAAQEQALRQQQLDQQYQDFVYQRDFPMEQLQQYSSLLRGVPVTPNTTSTASAPAPSLASQIMGTGLGALGMYKSLAG